MIQTFVQTVIMKNFYRIVFVLYFIIYFIDINKDNFWIRIIWFIPTTVILHFAVKKYLEYYKFKKLPGHWTKLRKAYEADKFGDVKKTIPAIRKIEDDHVLKLIEAEMYLYGKTVFQDYFKAIEIYEEVNKIQPPAKTKWEKNPYTKKYAAKTKNAQKKKKKEDYIKKIKSRAIESWNANNLSEIKNRYQRIIHTEEPIEVKGG